MDSTYSLCFLLGLYFTILPHNINSRNISPLKTLKFVKLTTFIIIEGTAIYNITVPSILYCFKYLKTFLSEASSFLYLHSLTSCILAYNQNLKDPHCLAIQSLIDTFLSPMYIPLIHYP